MDNLAVFRTLGFKVINPLVVGLPLNGLAYAWPGGKESPPALGFSAPPADGRNGLEAVLHGKSSVACP